MFYNRNIFVCTILQEVHKCGPVRARNFYDDIVSRTAGRSLQETGRTLVNHGIRAAKVIAGSRLCHNKAKTVIVASSNALAKYVAEGLKHASVNIKVAWRTKDLGLDAGGGTRRATKTSKSRIIKAMGNQESCPSRQNIPEGHQAC